MGQSWADAGGKELFRDAEGRAGGVIDATFADVSWDMERVS